MAFIKFLVVLFALFAVVYCADNTTTTPTPTPAPSSNTWNVLDVSSPDTLNLIFWVPVSSNATQQQAYQLVVNNITTSAGSVTPLSGSFTKVFNVTKGASSANWALTGDTTGDTYFTANVNYPRGPVDTTFTVYVLNGTSGNQYGAPGSSNPSTTEAFFNNKGAFIVVKSGSTSFTTGNTTVSYPLAVNTTQTSTSATAVVGFSGVSTNAVFNSNTTNTDGSYTVYIGAGSPPGGHVVLIIIICVAAGVVLSIIIFVVIYLRRRRNYERID